MVLCSSPMRKGLAGPFKDSKWKPISSSYKINEQANKQTTHPGKKKTKNTSWNLEDLTENEDPNPLS